MLPAKIVGPVPPASSPLLAGVRGYARGVAVHSLLQHVPAVAEAARGAAIRAYLERAGFEGELRAELAQQVKGVLRHPALRVLFGPGSRAEQPLSGVVGGQVVSGVVDRMVVLLDRVVVADFKTGREAPEAVEGTPVRYLRQLAAYRGVLRGLFPERAVSCLLVWTEGAVVSEVPDMLLDRVAPCLDGSHLLPQ